MSSIYFLIGLNAAVASMGMLVVTSPAAAQKLESDTLSKVCRAAVGALMNQDPKIIRSDKVEEGIAYVSYNRPSDGKLWKNRCRVEGREITWGAVDAFGPGSGDGRWRTKYDDGSLTYSLSGRAVTILQEHLDGSKSSKTFTLD
jgi:hypothetical protein